MKNCFCLALCSNMLEVSKLPQKRILTYLLSICTLFCLAEGLYTAGEYNNYIIWKLNDTRYDLYSIDNMYSLRLKRAKHAVTVLLHGLWRNKPSNEDEANWLHPIYTSKKGEVLKSEKRRSSSNTNQTSQPSKHHDKAKRLNQDKANL